MKMLTRSLVLFAILATDPAAAQQRGGDDLLRDTGRGAAGAIGGMLHGSVRRNR